MQASKILKDTTLTISFPYIINSNYAKQIYYLTLEELKTIICKGTLIHYDIQGDGEIYIIAIDELLSSIYNIEGATLPTVTLSHKNKSLQLKGLSLHIMIKKPSFELIYDSHTIKTTPERLIENALSVSCDVSFVVIKIFGTLHYSYY